MARICARLFAPGKDHLGKSLAQGPVVIHPGEAQVFKGQGAEALQGLGHAQFAGLHLFQ